MRVTSTTASTARRCSTGRETRPFSWLILAQALPAARGLERRHPGHHRDARLAAEALAAGGGDLHQGLQGPVEDLGGLPPALLVDGDRHPVQGAVLAAVDRVGVDRLADLG